MAFPDQDTVSDDDRAGFLRLHEEGHPVRAIARQTGWSHATVSRHLTRMGADTDRAGTTEATTARIRVLNAQRLDRAEDLMRDIEDLRHRIWDRYDVVVSGPDGPATVHLDEPPLKEQADGFRAIEAMVRTINTLIDSIGDDAADEGKSTINRLFASLTALVDSTGLGRDPQDQDHDYDIADDEDQAAVL